MTRLFFFFTLILLLFFRPFFGHSLFSRADIYLSWIITLNCLVLTVFNKKTAKKDAPPSLLTGAVCVFFGLILARFVFPFGGFFRPQALADYVCFASLFLAARTLPRNLQPGLIFASGITAAAVSSNALLWLGYGSSCLLAFMHEHHIVYDFASEYISRGRAFMPFNLPSLLGGYLMLGIPLCFVSISVYYKEADVLLTKRPLRNSLLIVPFLLALAGLLATQAVGAFISFAAALLLYFSLTRSGKTRFFSVLAGTLLLLLSGMLFLRSYHAGYWQNPIFSLGQRMLYWQNTLNVIKENIIWGTGLGDLPFVGARYSHNSFLQLWAEGGIAVFFAFLAVVLFSLKDFASFLKKAPGDKLFPGLFIAYSAFIFHNLVDFSFFVAQGAFLWWIILGLADNMASTRRGENS